jgi:NTE family protein
MKKIGVVLSGGGVRGFAHLGVLKALDELGIRPYAISGVSSGAIVVALYAAGNSPEKILEFMKGNSYFGWSNFFLRKAGFFSMAPLLNILQKYIADDSFEQLATKLLSPRQILIQTKR